MTGLGRIVALVTFLIIAYYQSRKHKTQFRKIFYRLPLPIIVAYIGGSYMSFFLNHGQIIPLSIGEIQAILSPHDFSFHYVGLLLGIIISIYIFLHNIHSKTEQYRWIEIISTAIAGALIPLGLFLVMGDNFIGIPHNTWGRTTFRGDVSKRSSLGKVLPIGMFISITGIIGTIFSILTRDRTTKRGYITLSIISLGIAITLLFQNAPKYGILRIGSIIVDIKTYASFFTIMICLQQFFLQYKNHPQYKTIENEESTSPPTEV